MVFVSYFSQHFSLVWVAGRWSATVVVCFSFQFAFIEFSLKRFPSFFILITLCPLTPSRFDALAEFGTLAEYSFGPLADC